MHLYTPTPPPTHPKKKIKLKKKWLSRNTDNVSEWIDKSSSINMGGVVLRTTWVVQQGKELLK